MLVILLLLAHLIYPLVKCFLSFGCKSMALIAATVTPSLYEITYANVLAIVLGGCFEVLMENFVVRFIFLSFPLEIGQIVLLNLFVSTFW